MKEQVFDAVRIPLVYNGCWIQTDKICSYRQDVSGPHTSETPHVVTTYEKAAQPFAIGLGLSIRSATCAKDCHQCSNAIDWAMC